MELKKVLLVDDDDAINFLNRLTIQEYVSNCQIDEALNGQIALDYLATTETCPDIIFLDINMPQLDGFDFLKHFDATAKCVSHSQIYMLTSSERDDERQLALSHSSVKGFWSKPLSPEHLQELLQKQ